MAVLRKGLTLEESYLVAMIQDESGIDLAEFMWEDPMASNEENLFRCWDFQYAWWRNTFAGGRPIPTPTLVIDSCGRTIGKTMSIIVRAWAFPIQHPGAEMVVTAPELIHLDPLISRIEDRIKETRLTNEMLPKHVGKGSSIALFRCRSTTVPRSSGVYPSGTGGESRGFTPCDWRWTRPRTSLSPAGSN